MPARAVEPAEYRNEPAERLSILGPAYASSRKIMRRILRKIAANETDTLGDTSTLADPAVVDDLVHNRAHK